MTLDTQTVVKNTSSDVTYRKIVTDWLIENFRWRRNGSKELARLVACDFHSISHRTAENYIKGKRVPADVTIAILEARRPDLAALLAQERETLRELLSKTP